MREKGTARADKKARSIEALLTSAKHEFHLRGFVGADIRTIARNAGVSTGCLFRHWPSKAALWHEINGHADDLSLFGVNGQS